MQTPIRLVCTGCGREADYDRSIDQSIPAEVVKIVMNECDECNAAAGGYGTEEWYDASGRHLHPL